MLDIVRLKILCVRLFFFFKQKTAYEMRISDWSSDVCSSDLATDVVLGALILRLLEDLRGRSVFHEHTGTVTGRVIGEGGEEGGPVGDARSLLHVVSDDDDRVLAPQVMHEILDAHRRYRVQRRARLAHQDHAGLPRDGAGAAQALDRKRVV